MTSWANADWNERDQAARAELTREHYPFGYSTRRGRTSPAGMVEIRRNGSAIGSVTVYRTRRDWLIETFKIYLDGAHRFRKDIHAGGGYQPRWGLFLMEHLLDAFPDKEIRESAAVNDVPGGPFVARVRMEYKLAYHLPTCFPADRDEECVCGVGRRCAPVLET